MARIRKMTPPNVDKDMEQQELSLIVSETTKWYSPFGRQLVVSCKTKYTFTMQSSNHALGIYLKERNIYIHTKTYTQIFMSALFLIAKTWRQPICPPVG